MSYAIYKTVETGDSTREGGDGMQRRKPFVVPGGQKCPDDCVARRVAEVLDFELARGSMPT